MMRRNEIAASRAPLCSRCALAMRSASSSRAAERFFAPVAAAASAALRSSVTGQRNLEGCGDHVTIGEHMLGGAKKSQTVKRFAQNVTVLGIAHLRHRFVVRLFPRGAVHPARVAELRRAVVAVHLEAAALARDEDSALRARLGVRAYPRFRELAASTSFPRLAQPRRNHRACCRAVVAVVSFHGAQRGVAYGSRGACLDCEDVRGSESNCGRTNCEQDSHEMSAVIT